MPKRVAHTACLVLIGNELLSGKTRDENLHPLATTLRALGVRLERVTVIPDDLELVAREVRAARTTWDLVITSGGVGPTHDDVTMEGVARAFDVATASNPELERMLRRAYGAQLTQAHLRMALIPEGAALEIDEEVTWPTIVKDNVWILPGIPELFRAKLVALRRCVRGPIEFISRAVYTKLDEGELKPLLDRVVAAHPTVEVGSYPKWFDPSYSTKITLDGTAGPALELALQELLSLLPSGEPQRVD